MSDARFNSVRILEEDLPDTGQLDANRKSIAHTVIIERVGDGVILGKYRATETTLEQKEVKGLKGHPSTLKTEEVEISGHDAAVRACKVNNWKIVR